MFLYTNKLSERGIKKIIPLIIASKRIKYIGKNSTKEVKDWCTENYKTLMKEIDDDTNKWKDILCSWSRSVNVKMPILGSGARWQKRKMWISPSPTNTSKIHLHMEQFSQNIY